MRNRILIIILFLVLTPILPATDKVCHTCGQEITQKYISAQGYYFHPNHFICDYCSDRIDGTKYYFENNRFFHTECYEKLNRLNCAFCGDNISGRYVEYDGKKYHQECYTKNIALKCDLCSGVLNGPYILDLRGNRYHADHKDVHPQCHYCKLFIGTDGIEGFTNSSGQNICGECMNRAIDTEDELEELFEIVNEQLKEYGLDVDLDEIELKLGDKDKINELFNVKTEKNLMGFTYFEKTTGFFGFFEQQKIVIYLLDGMPYMWAVNAAAHELNHAWQFARDIHDKNLDYSEGSANYSSYLVLQSYLDQQFTKYLIELMLEDEDVIYGEGFRRVKYIVDHNGLNYWKDHLAHNKSFPEGY